MTRDGKIIVGIVCTIIGLASVVPGWLVADANRKTCPDVHEVRWHEDAPPVGACIVSIDHLDSYPIVHLEERVRSHWINSFSSRNQWVFCPQLDGESTVIDPPRPPKQMLPEVKLRDGESWSFMSPTTAGTKLCWGTGSDSCMEYPKAQAGYRCSISCTKMEVP